MRILQWSFTRGLLLTALAFLVTSVPAAPALVDVNDFSFSSFTGDYYLSRDAQHISHLRVVEHLVANFPATDQNHGILRALPNVYDGHGVNLKIKSVTDDHGTKLSYSKSNSNHNLVLKIGDAGRYVHGTQTYVITYDLDNVTAKPAGYDGFFWDINGDVWTQTFAQVTARIHLAPEVQPAYQPGHNLCYTGARGATTSQCTIETNSNDASLITATTTQPLTGGQTLTAQIGFAPDTFAAYTIPPGQIWRWVLLILGLGVLPIGLTLWYVLRRWLRYGRDPSGRGVIIPEYIPPKELSVLGASALLNEGFQPIAISATILDLAVRGYLKIYEVKQKALFKDKTTYEIELVRDLTGLKPEETDVAKLLFDDTLTPGTRVKLDDLANKLYAGAKTIGSGVNQTLTTAGYFKTNPEKAGNGLLILGFVLLIPCLLPSVYIIGFAVSGLICIIMSRVMPARTAAGVEQRDYLLGLKQFITVAEAERIKIMQSPRGNLTEKIDTGDNAQLVKLYEKLLPYAMIFGIEKQWAKQFAALYGQDPSWYVGSSSFNAGYFAGSLSSFSEASTASFTPPSSSSSGGSAGGGGGGGGGGGW